ncbi:hypothetical protein KI387_004891, partial [Taxus chinensis]
VAQVLLTLPFSFSQLGMVSGILFQIFYGLMGSWIAYLISVLYVEYHTRKEKENYSFRNHVIQKWHHHLPVLPVRRENFFEENARKSVFAPYFPPDQPLKFANVYRIFGESNITKLLRVATTSEGIFREYPSIRSRCQTKRSCVWVGGNHLYYSE